jgi:hypothetical protein
MPPKLQDRMPMGGGQQPGMQQGQMDWRQMLQAIFKANPGISPQIAGMAVTKALPLMNMASKQEWLMAHNQFLQQQLEARERMLQERERGLGDRLTQRGQQAQGLEGTKQQGRMNLQDKRGDQASDRQQDQQEFQAEQGALTRGSREGIAAANRAARPNSIEPSDAAIDAVGNYKRPPPLRSDKNFWNKLAAKYPDYDEKIWENSQSGARAEGRTSGGRIGGLNVVLDALEAAVQPALERSKTVSRQGFVPLDKIIQGGQIITNDTELNRFGVANLQLAELWAKAMNPGGVMRVDDRNKALEFLSTAKSQEAYEANVNQIVSQIRRERDSIQAGRQKVLNPMGAKETEGAPSPKSKEEYDALPSGTEFTDPQGVKRRKP